MLFSTYYCIIKVWSHWHLKQKNLTANLSQWKRCDQWILAGWAGSIALRTLFSLFSNFLLNEMLHNGKKIQGLLKEIMLFLVSFLCLRWWILHRLIEWTACALGRGIFGSQKGSNQNSSQHGVRTDTWKRRWLSDVCSFETTKPKSCVLGCFLLPDTIVLCPDRPQRRFLIRASCFRCRSVNVWWHVSLDVVVLTGSNEGEN